VNLALRQFKIFEAMARHQNFTHVSKALHLNQPAVSMRIKQLEEAAGLALFEQVGKRIDLTEAGFGLPSLHTLEMELALKRPVILHVRDRPILRKWDILRRSGKRLSAVAQTFKDFMITESAQILDRLTLQ